jgi:transposase
MIRELYLVERALWDRDQPISSEHRVRVRAELSAPIVTKFHAWLEALAPKVLPQSLLGKAVHYTLGQWPKLIRFLEHGDIPLDNNRCENAIRPFVVGRNYPRVRIMRGLLLQRGRGKDSLRSASHRLH